MTLNLQIILKSCKIHRRFQIEYSKCLHTRILSTPVQSRTTRLYIDAVCNLTNRVSYGTPIFVRGFGTQVPRPYVDPKLSYVFSKSNEHLIYSTVSREFDKKVNSRPDDIAFVSFEENKEVNFRQLHHDVNKLSKAMVKQFNVKKGDFIGVFAYNCYNWVVAQFACSRVGAILAPINPSYKSNELAFILKKGKIKCLFMPGPRSVQYELNDHLSVLQSDKIVAMTKANELEIRNVIFIDGENEYTISRDKTDKSKSEASFINNKLANCEMNNWSTTENDGLVYNSVQDAEEAGLNEDDACILNLDLLSPDDLFAVYYTSGTTGNPKGACISHFTVINNVNLAQIRLRNGRPRNLKFVGVTTLPMFHIFAGVLNSLGPIVSNSVLVYSSHRYDIKAFVDAIYKYNANFVTLTPTILIDMLSYIETNNLTGLPLKIVQPGGAALAPEMVARAFRILPNLEELRTGYGSTENGSVATFQTIHEPAEVRSLTVGPPMDLTEIRVVKPNTDDLVAHMERGEIQTRGYNTMIEYLDEPEKTAEVITPNRWYRTGDIGFMHPHGSIQLCGRLKHMIIKGGENIYPEEVQQLIHKLHYVEDVHVVGVPDKRFGEQVCAWVKLKSGFQEAKSSSVAERSKKQVHKDDIIKYCKENITYFKVPKYLLFVDDFPMTPTKKIQNHIMTAKSIEILGLEDQQF